MKPLKSRADIIREREERQATREAKRAKPSLKAKYVTKGGRNSDLGKLRFIRSRECMVKASPSTDPCEGLTEAHHDRPKGAPANDARTVPLCVGHHRTGQYSVQALGRNGFELFHKLDMDAAVDHYETEYRAHEPDDE